MAGHRHRLVGGRCRHLIAVPHLIQDDGRLLVRYLEGVKRVPAPVPQPLLIAIDQSFHFAALFVVALLSHALAS